MANCCFFDMHVSGTESGVNRLIGALNENLVGRIYGYDIYDHGVNEDGIQYVYLCGDCAWSIQSAILDKGVLQQIIKAENLNVEIYSEEPGLEFMEHYLFENGEITADECKGCIIQYIEDLEADEEALDYFLSRKEVKQEGITKDNYHDFAEDEYIKIGGFDYNWAID